MITDERITAYLNSLGQELSPQLYELEMKAKKNMVPIIKKESQGVIRFFLKTQKPKNILEVGTAIGFSALFMSEYSSKDCKIDTIEKSPKCLVEAKSNFANEIFPSRDKISLWEGEALEILEDLVIAKAKYDFIFLDAAKGQYMNFLPSLIELIEEGGLLITDNVLQDGTVVNSRYSISRRDRTIHSRMREYLYEISHMDELETLILPVGDGLALSYRKS